MTKLKGLQEKWDSLKRKTVMRKVINIAFINKTLSLTSEECGLTTLSLREKSPQSEFFWSVLSRIPTGY